MTLRCEQCGHENDSRYRFCGMCGAKLPLPARETAAPRMDPGPKPAARPVSGPSFLGLADDPADPVSYLLEDEPSTGRWGRYLVLAIFLAGIVGAAWYWRRDLTSLASRFSGGSPAIPSQQTPGLAGAPAAASPSDPQPSGTPPVTPPASGDRSQTAPTSLAPVPQAGAPASNQAQTGEASGSSSAAPGGSNPAADSEPSSPSLSPAATASGDNSQPANSDAKDETGADNGASSGEAAPAVKPRAAVKTSRNSADPVPAGSESDALETQGEKYLYGNGVPANCALAQKSLLAAAERSNTKAQSVLGTMYATGHCATRDLPLAYRWFARALHQDPSNLRIEQDLKVLWSQMSPDERQLALRATR